MDTLLEQLPSLLLVSCRVGGVTTVSPVFQNRFIMPQVRAILSILLALVMLPATQVVPGAQEGFGLAVACLLELVVGLVIGFLSLLLFSVVQIAGSILDFDMGLSMAQLVDPVSSYSQPLLGTFFRTLALVFYFLVDAHHVLVLGLAESYQVLPAGALIASSAGFFEVASLFGHMLAIAVKLVLPFLAVMLLTSAVMALANRAVQQLQVFQLGLGIKAVAGLALLGLMLPYFFGVLEPLFMSGQNVLLHTLERLR